MYITTNQNGQHFRIRAILRVSICFLSLGIRWKFVDLYISDNKHVGYGNAFYSRHRTMNVGLYE